MEAETESFFFFFLLQSRNNAAIYKNRSSRIVHCYVYLLDNGEIRN